jgi:hypothetical protein
MQRHSLEAAADEMLKGFKQDSDGDGAWVVAVIPGSGVHETLHVDALGNILPDCHTTFERTQFRFEWMTGDLVERR